MGQGCICNGKYVTSAVFLKVANYDRFTDNAAITQMDFLLHSCCISFGRDAGEDF